MATAQPSWSYWANTFVAQLLQPVNCNALFTVGLIIITDIFPEDTKALAGAVFNTAAQFGTAFVFAILQSSVVTGNNEVNEDKITALLAGVSGKLLDHVCFHDPLEIRPHMQWQGTCTRSS